MKRLYPLCFFLLVVAAPLFAGPTETAIMSIMRLSDQKSYSWVATVQDDARTYDIDGKTMRGGFTHVKMPVINTVRRRLGRSVTDTQIEMIFRGNVDCVLNTDDGWKTADELPPPEDEEMDNAPVHAASHTSVPGTGIIGGGIMKGAVIRRPKLRQPEREERHYSNLQLAISHPHEDLGVIVSSHLDFQVGTDTVSGTLTDLGAQLLLVRDGQKQITPHRAAGTFKIWLREGFVTKYLVKLEGVLTVDTPTGRRNVAVSQVTNTVLKDIGTTKFEVPEQARRRLLR